MEAIYRNFVSFHFAMNQKHVCQASSEMKLISQENLKVNISSGAASTVFMNTHFRHERILVYFSEISPGLIRG